MNWEALGAIGEIIGAATVLSGGTNQNAKPSVRKI